MKAGRERDALIAEKVMGYSVATRMCLREYETGIWQDAESWHDDKEGRWSLEALRNSPDMEKHFCYADEFGHYKSVLHYSTRIQDAWRVVEKMAEYDTDVHNGICINYDEGRWYVEFPLPNWEYAEADTASLAICLAALKAVGHG